MDTRLKPNAGAGDGEGSARHLSTGNDSTAGNTRWQDIEAARSALRTLPAVRVLAVKRARRLAHDPAYPLPQVLERVASWFARHWTRD